MKREKGVRTFRRLSFGIVTLACAMLFGIASTARSQAQANRESGRVLGLSFDSIQVSNLEKSIDYYKTLGFTPLGATNPPWTSDALMDRLYNTKGAQSRTATLTMPSVSSGAPFILYLREYKDIDRKSRENTRARDPSSSHIALTVPDADALWAQLKSAEMLRPLTWGGELIRRPGQSTGGIAYIMDPDGMSIEIVGRRPAAPATADKLETPAENTGFNHIGLVVLDSDKSKAFYGNLLSAQFPNVSPQWLSGDFYDSVVGGRGYIIRLFNGTFAEAAAPEARMRFELVEYQNPTRKAVDDYRYSDYPVNCIGLEVAGLDAFYARLKAAGIVTWSVGGIVQQKDGTRAVVVRDPDVGAFVELFEKPKK